MLKKHKSRIVGFLLLCCLSPVKAKEVKGTVSWSSTTDSSIHVLSMVTGEHLAYFSNHIDTLPKFTVNDENANLLVGKLGKLFSRGSLWVAAFPGSGRVFEIDTINNTIDRQDRTTYQGYNFYAYQFQRKDTIFSFGGYGFWVENNLLTYFSEARREWNRMSNAPFPNISPDPTQRRKRMSFYDRTHDVLFTQYNNVMYAYDFLNQTWSEKGELDSELNGFNHRITDSTLLVMTGKAAWEIDFYGNRILDRGIEKGLIYNLTAPFEGFSCMYELGEHILLMPKTSDVIPIGYSFEYFVTKRKDQGNGEIPLFRSSAERHLQFAFLVFPVLLILFLLAKSRSVFYLKSRKIKTIHRDFSLTQINTLSRLLSGSLLAEDLNNILNVQEKSWEVQRRQRSIFLKKLNELGVKLLNSELVLREKSPTDKRQVVYVVNSEIKDQLAQLLP
tara:strand:+ start:1120 stop:2454 length:1335 start_codon:yes stop_codon:yes gene_type:complete